MGITEGDIMDAHTFLGITFMVHRGIFGFSSNELLISDKCCRVFEKGVIPYPRDN
jgi:hypothetical protein